MTLKVWLICIFYFVLTAELDAKAQYQDHEAITQAVSQYLLSTAEDPTQDFEVQVAHLDSRLRLAQCMQPLHIFLPHTNQTSGNVTVGVRCQGQKPWTIYTKASIRVFKEIAILKKPLIRGTIISKNDIRFIKKDVSNLHRGYLTSLEDIINKQLKRSLSSGAILSPSNLIAQKVVKRGQKVSIRAANKLLDIRMSGHALMDGEAGQRIKVRNDHSKRIIEGRIIAPGVVRVSL